MKCEVVTEGVAPCTKAVAWIARKATSVKLACDDCSMTLNRIGYSLTPLDELLLCDWPISGGAPCNAAAAYYITVNDYPRPYQRPLCEAHAKGLHSSDGSVARLIEGYCDADECGFDPRLVPYKPPPQPPARITQKADLSVEMLCHCGEPGRFRGGVDTYPLCDEHAPAPQTAAVQDIKLPRVDDAPPPTLRDIFIDVASSILDLAQRKLNALRRPPP